MPPLKDLTGKRYGNLVVLRREGTYTAPKGSSTPTWLCKCDCGNTITVVGHSLKYGYTKSCGCQHWVHEFHKYKIDNNTVYITVKDKQVMIDKEDLSKIYPQHLFINNKGYACLSRGQLLHRLIMECPRDKVIDHINHNTLDNRKENLRIVTQAQNSKNKRCRSNTGYTGITKTSKGYYVVQLDGKYIGNFKSLDMAIKSRNEYLPKSDHAILNTVLDVSVNG